MDHFSAYVQQLNPAKPTHINSIETNTTEEAEGPLMKIQDVEADFQIWDMEENYTGKHNIKAKKSTPENIYRAFNLDLAAETGTEHRFKALIKKIRQFSFQLR